MNSHKYPLKPATYNQIIVESKILLVLQKQEKIHLNHMLNVFLSQKKKKHTLWKFILSPGNFKTPGFNLKI